MKLLHYSFSESFSFFSLNLRATKRITETDKRLRYHEGSWAVGTGFFLPLVLYSSRQCHAKSHNEKLAQQLSIEMVGRPRVQKMLQWQHTGPSTPRVSFHCRVRAERYEVIDEAKKQTCAQVLQLLPVFCISLRGPSGDPVPRPVFGSFNADICK